MRKAITICAAGAMTVLVTALGAASPALASVHHAANQGAAQPAAVHSAAVHPDVLWGYYSSEYACDEAGIDGIFEGNWNSFSCTPYNVGWTTLWALYVS